MQVLSSNFDTILCLEAASDAFRKIYSTGTVLGNSFWGRGIMPDSVPQQLLHLVLGGELADLEHNTFKDLSQVEIVGLFPNYASAHIAWRAKAQQTVDNAQMRYFIVHLHRLLDPDQDAKPAR
jgi:uncharacterized protein DUF4170